MAAEPTGATVLDGTVVKDAGRAGRMEQTLERTGVIIAALGLVCALAGNVLNAIQLYQLLVPEPVPTALGGPKTGMGTPLPPAREETVSIHGPGFVGLELAVDGAPDGIVVMAALGSQGVHTRQFKSRDLHVGAKGTTEDTCALLVSADQSVRQDAVIMADSAGGPDLPSAEVPAEDHVPRSAVGNDRMALLTLPGLPEVGARWTVHSTVTVDLHEYQVDSFVVTVVSVDGWTVVLELGGAGQITCAVPRMDWA